MACEYNEQLVGIMVYPPIQGLKAQAVFSVGQELLLARQAAAADPTYAQLASDAAAQDTYTNSSAINWALPGTFSNDPSAADDVGNDCSALHLPVLPTVSPVKTPAGPTAAQEAAAAAQTKKTCGLVTSFVDRLTPGSQFLQGDAETAASNIYKDAEVIGDDAPGTGGPLVSAAESLLEQTGSLVTWSNQGGDDASLPAVIGIEKACSLSAPMSTTSTSAPPQDTELQVSEWLDGTGTQDFDTLQNDLTELSTASSKNDTSVTLGDCQTLSTDVSSMQNGPAIPDATLEQQWSEALEDYSTGANACVNGLAQNSQSLANQSSTDFEHAGTAFNGLVSSLKSVADGS